MFGERCIQVMDIYHLKTNVNKNLGKDNLTNNDKNYIKSLIDNLVKCTEGIQHIATISFKIFREEMS